MSEPKKVFEPNIEPKNIPIGPQKSKQPQNYVKIKCQNWRKQRKWKLFDYMSRPQNNFNLTPTLKIAYFLSKKTKKIALYLDEIESNIDNICCSATQVDLKYILNYNTTPLKAQFLPLFNVNLSQLQLNWTSPQVQLNLN